MTRIHERLNLINPGFETGDLTGWTVEAGTPVVYSSGAFLGKETDPFEGGNFHLFLGTTDGTSVSQIIEIPQCYLSLIDSSHARILSEWLHLNYLGSERVEVSFEFLDSSQNLISSVPSPVSTPSSSEWVASHNETLIPRFTRFIKLIVTGTRSGVGNVNVFVDSIKLLISTDIEFDFTSSVVNPNAETGNTTGWTSDVGSFIVRSFSPTPDEGSFYFACGRIGPKHVAFQVVPIPSQFNDIIDSGNALIKLSFLEMSGNSNTTGRCYLNPLDSFDQTLVDFSNEIKIRSSSSDEFQRKHLYFKIPKGTRKVKIILEGHTTSSVSDQYFDDIRLSILQKDLPEIPGNLIIPNHNAETGTLDGWNVETGNVQIKSSNPLPKEGSNYFNLGVASNDVTFSREIFIPTDLKFLIEAGFNLTLKVSWLQNSSGSNDGGCQIDFFDVNGILISSSPLRQTAPNDWTRRIERVSVPTNSHSFKIIFKGLRSTGTDIDFFVDDVRVECSFDENFEALTNPGAETGDLTGWTIDSGNAVVRQTNPNPSEGAFYFHVGSGVTTTSKFSQNFTLPSNTHSLIDAGQMNVIVQWDQAHTSLNDDNGGCQIDFFDSNDVLISSTTLESISHSGNSQFIRREVETSIPANTRSLKLIFQGDYQTGTEIDFFVDDVSLQLWTPINTEDFLPLKIDVQNHNFETGDLTGWNQRSGTSVVKSDNPFIGLNHVHIGVGGSASLEQSLNFDPIIFNLIDDGNLQLHVNWRQNSLNGEDEGGCFVEFFDGNGVVISSSPLRRFKVKEWVRLHHNVNVPRNARSFNIVFDGLKNSADADCDFFVDVVECELRKIIEDLPLVNPNADTGDLTGWTVEAGTPTVVGNQFEIPFGAILSQIVDLNQLSISLVSVNSALIHVEWEQNCPTFDDDGGILIDFLDSNSNVIQSSKAVFVASDANGLNRIQVSNPPKETTKIKVKLQNPSGNGATRFDNIKVLVVEKSIENRESHRVSVNSVEVQSKLSQGMRTTSHFTEVQSRLSQGMRTTSHFTEIQSKMPQRVRATSHFTEVMMKLTAENLNFLRSMNPVAVVRKGGNHLHSLQHVSVISPQKNNFIHKGSVQSLLKDPNVIDNHVFKGSVQSLMRVDGDIDLVHKGSVQSLMRVDGDIDLVHKGSVQALLQNNEPFQNKSLSLNSIVVLNEGPARDNSLHSITQSSVISEGEEKKNSLHSINQVAVVEVPVVRENLLHNEILTSVISKSKTESNIIHSQNSSTILGKSDTENNLLHQISHVSVLSQPSQRNNSLHSISQSSVISEGEEKKNSLHSINQVAVVDVPQSADNFIHSINQVAVIEPPNDADNMLHQCVGTNVISQPNSVKNVVHSLGSVGVLSHGEEKKNHFFSVNQSSVISEGEEKKNHLHQISHVSIFGSSFEMKNISLNVVPHCVISPSQFTINRMLGMSSIVVLKPHETRKNLSHSLSSISLLRKPGLSQFNMNFNSVIGFGNDFKNHSHSLNLNSVISQPGMDLNVNHSLLNSSVISPSNEMKNMMNSLNIGLVVNPPPTNVNFIHSISHNAVLRVPQTTENSFHSMNSNVVVGESENSKNLLHNEILTSVLSTPKEKRNLNLNLTGSSVVSHSEKMRNRIHSIGMNVVIDDPVFLNNLLFSENSAVVVALPSTFSNFNHSMTVTTVIDKGSADKNFLRNCHVVSLMKAPPPTGFIFQINVVVVIDDPSQGSTGGFASEKGKTDFSEDVVKEDHVRFIEEDDEISTWKDIKT